MFFTGFRRSIVHRDMKPENVLLTCHDPHKCRAKISDFGLVQINHFSNILGMFHVKSMVSGKEWV